jgi:type II secretory pathway pseudopilin PulG
MTVRRQKRVDSASGFTLIELIMIILLLSILSVAVVAKWPTGMDTEAAALEFKRAVRYAQHMAMTREFIAGNAWGLFVDVATSKYTVQRRDGSEKVPDFTDRSLLDGNTMIITGGPASPATGLWFNGLGEPVSDNTSVPLSAVTYTVAGAESMTICPQTGYIVRGAICP